MNSQSPSETEVMRARIAELEERLSRDVSTNVSNPMTTSDATLAHTPEPSSITWKDSEIFGRPIAITKSIVHKNRVLGQSHWMNGFVLVGLIQD